MFYASALPVMQHRHRFSPAGRSLERFLAGAMQAPAGQASTVDQDDKTVTLTFDVPGVTREQLNIGIEGNVVRIQSREGAPRQYRAAYELPQDIDVANSQAKLENGVLTVTLAKVLPVSQVTELAIN